MHKKRRKMVAAVCAACGNPGERRADYVPITGMWFCSGPCRTAKVSTCIDCAAPVGMRRQRCRVCEERKWKAPIRDSLNAKKRAEYAANPEPVRAKNKASYGRHRTKRNAESKAWALANPERARAIWKKSHDRPEARARRDERGRQYRKKNPEYSRMLVTRRRNRIRSVGGDFSKAEWDAIVKKQRGRCAGCQQRRKLTVDHIVPVSKGGCNYAFNLQGLCRACNTRKHNKIETPVVSLFDRPEERAIRVHNKLSKVPMEMP